MVKIHPYKELNFYNWHFKKYSVNSLLNKVNPIFEKYGIKEFMKKKDKNWSNRDYDIFYDFKIELNKYLETWFGKKGHNHILGNCNVSINTSIIFANLFMYHLYTICKIIDMMDFIHKVWNEFGATIEPVYARPRWGLLDYNLKNLHTFYFLSLKWFYSDETKHLYSDDLLKKMKEYEESIKEIKWEDCIIDPDNKFFRLKF